MKFIKHAMCVIGAIAAIAAGIGAFMYFTGRLCSCKCCCEDDCCCDDSTEDIFED